MGNTTEARTIYILLTRSGTWFSRLIHLATADSYTHASIGLDGPIGPFYSFARKYSHFALPAGLVEEQIGPELRTKRQQVPCCLYELSVSPEIYASLRRQISAMYAQRQRYHYNLLGALSCFFNLPLDRRDHYFCSQFVAGLLRDSGALELSKPPALVRPADFCQIHHLPFDQRTNFPVVFFLTPKRPVRKRTGLFVCFIVLSYSGFRTWLRSSSWASPHRRSRS